MISQEFLNDVADYMDGRVAKVVLNEGEVIITDFFIKDITGSELTLQYMVLAGSVTDITLIELQDASGGVISANEVEIPITADTIMIQTILVKEG